jgi:general secretion pathway protein A
MPSDSTADMTETFTTTREVEPAAAGAGAHEPSHVLATLLSSRDFPTDSVSAAHELFNRWHATYDPSRGTACSQAATQQLQCMFLSGGSISELRRLNRPAMLTLTDDNGSKHHVVMTALGYDDVELSAGDRSERVEIAELTHYWFGQDLLLWKPLGPESEDLVLGARGPAVRWLRESLAKVLDEPVASADPELFDEGLAERVREFQRRQRLEVDGIVGTRTIIALQSALALPDVPMLSQVN